MSRTLLPSRAAKGLRVRFSIARLRAAALAAVLLAPHAAAAAPCGPSPVTFTSRTIASDYTYAYGIAVGDLDRDGDPDVTSADTTSDVLYWYANDGAGSFARHVDKQNDAGWFERHVLVDMDGDGWLDVVVVKLAVNTIVWFENDGTPEDGGWIEHEIAPGTMPYAYDVDSADLDGDGDIDVAASSYAGNELAWFENTGDPTGAWVKHPIARGEITLTVRIADFDGDGLPDILSSALDTGLYWYENTGAPASSGFVEHVMMRRGRPSHGEPVDLDGDGDLDVVMARGGAVSKRGDVSWFENRGKPRFVGHRIQQRLPQAFEAVSGDVDGDGDVDVALSVWGYPGGLMWFENRGRGRRWCKRVILDVWQNGNSVLLRDLDADGRLDLISTAERGTNELRWWRNDAP